MLLGFVHCDFSLDAVCEAPDEMEARVIRDMLRMSALTEGLWCFSSMF